MAKHQPQIELMPIEKIKPYDKNAKIHTESQVQALVKVIQSQGWDVPIVVDKYGVIIKGHGRRLAALAMGLDKVPVIVRHDLSDAQVKAARLSDNRVAMGDFDVDMMRDELAALKTDGFDLSTTGFGDKELELMLGELDRIDLTVFDEAPSTGDSTSASQSTPDASAAVEATPDASGRKTFPVSDLLGFKVIPSEYKDDVVEFMQAIMDGEDDPAIAFGKYARNQVTGEDGAA
jgi:hypothetical protein